MKLEVGKCYRTRSGRKATVESIGSDDLGFPVYAKVDGYLCSYTHGGSYFGGVKSDLDLIDEWRDPEKHLEAKKEEPKGATISADTIDQIAVDSLLWHFHEYGELEPLQKEAFRIVLSYYGKQV